MSQHDNFHYSVSIKTNDEAVLNCLRALSQFAQSTGNSRITWGGTKKKDWESNGNVVTFRFSCPDYRVAFLNEASRVFKEGLWEKDGQSDNDPAKRQ